MVNKTMMLFTAEVDGSKSFKLVPIDKECPYLEAFYVPDMKILAIYSPQKKESFVFVDKMDTLQPIKLRVVSEDPKLDLERKVIEKWHEYHITEMSEIVEFVKAFAVNADEFGIEQYLSNTGL